MNERNEICVTTSSQSQNLAELLYVIGLLIAAAVVGVLQLLLAGIAPRIAAYFPICQAALLMSAAVWGTNLMVNQIAYVYAGLDPMSTILGWILYIAFVVVAGIISLVAAFWRVNPKKA